MRISALPPGIKLSTFFMDELIRGNREFQKFVANMASAMLRTANISAHINGALRAYEAAGGAPAFEAELMQLQVAMRALSAVVSPGEGEADIWPGRFHKLPFSPEQLATMQAAPGDAATNEVLFKLGRAEALSWAQHVGFPAALKRGGEGAAAAAAAAAGNATAAAAGARRLLLGGRSVAAAAAAAA